MENQNTPVVIQLENIQFAWTNDKAPTLNIQKFEIFVKEKAFIKGASGSGKTTLLGILGGVLQPQTGSVLTLGRELNALKGTDRDAFRANHIGFIFQMFNLLPYLSVIENVLLPCHFSKNRKNKALSRSGDLKTEAIRILTHLGLKGEKMLSTPVVELSVGQQQRVAAARALIGGPEILIADEPTSALDADSRESFLELLFQECQEFHTTLIFVSHDALLAKYFDRTIDMLDLNQAASPHPL